uniref:Metalloendopeptidase n=1 Tax=Knipowitschia caucasica TaxID=637954 RepID=A0AAV2LA88_KNICA
MLFFTDTVDDIQEPDINSHLDYQRSLWKWKMEMQAAARCHYGLLPSFTLRVCEWQLTFPIERCSSHSAPVTATDTMKLHLLLLALLMSLMMSPTIAAPNMDPTLDPEPSEPEPTEPEPTEPDEESVSNIIAKANKNLASAMSEGDIKSDGRRNALSCESCQWPKSGSYVNIFYHLSNSYTSEQKNFIRSVMTGLEDKTCIRFKDVNSVSWWKYLSHLSIYPGNGCWSYIGRVLNLRIQPLSLSSGCFTTATVQHELFHALGFTHEHSRSDRDDHVTVHVQNIQSDKLHNFNKYKTNNLYTPYDFNSVMQYHNWAWTSNKKATLTSKQNPGLIFGFAKVASDNDILRVNRYYKCNV